MSDTQFGKRDRAGHWKLYVAITDLRCIRVAGIMKLIGSYDLVGSGFGGLI
jgi:hypothetical protein